LLRGVVGRILFQDGGSFVNDDNSSPYFLLLSLLLRLKGLTLLEAKTTTTTTTEGTGRCENRSLQNKKDR
jgi:hypothetical protein